MARVSMWWGQGAVDMSAADFSDLADARVKVPNDHTMKLTLDGDVTILKGDFDFNKKGQITGGVVTSVEFGFGQYEDATFSRLKLDLETFSKVSNSKTLADDATLFDKLFSRADNITGGQENDIIDGGGGNDTILGGWGADDIWGGSGADIFVYEDRFDSDSEGADEIMDFSQAEGDKINLRDMADLQFNEIQVSIDGADTIIEVDVNGGGIMPFTIRLSGNITLTEADFLL